MRLCCIPICRNGKLDADASVGYHPFPADEETRNKWIEFIGVNPAKFRWRTKYVCSEHFLYSEIKQENNKKSLLQGAVPMVFAVNESDDDEECINREEVMNTQTSGKTDAAASSGTAGDTVSIPVIVQGLEILFCRMCLKKSSDLLPLTSKLHNTSMLDIIFSISGVKVELDDVCPQSICPSCVGKADLAFNIRMEFIHHQKILYDLLNSQQLQNYYKNFDTYKLQSKSFNESYINDLLTQVKKEIAAPVIYAQIPPEQTGEKADHKQEPPLSITSEIIEEEMVEEHLYEERDLFADEENLSEAETQGNPTANAAPQNGESYVEHDNSANILKQEEDSDDEDPHGPPKHVFSWKELYKPKPVPKQRRPAQYWPKPKFIPNTCYVCDCSFEDAEALENHMVNHLPMLPYTCDNCNTEAVPQVFKTLIALNKHLQSHRYPYLCDYCPLRFLTNHTYVDHMRNIHEEVNKDGHTCHYCGQHFAIKRKYQSHVAKHDAMASNKYKCSYCERSFGNNSLLKRHIRIHTGENPFECKKCGRKFNHEANFLTHKRLHIGEKGYICSECGKNFISGTMLRYHMAEHFPNDPRYRTQPTTQRPRNTEGSTVLNNGERIYCCTVEGCDFTSTLYWQYSNHRNMHLKKFECEQCYKCFPLRAGLSKHIATVHEGKTPEKNLSCPYCPKLFASKQKLNLHVDVHENNRRHKCKFCDKNFVQKVNCVAHERIHTGERPYPCRTCSASFITSTCRKKHEKIHQQQSAVLESDSQQASNSLNADDVEVEEDEEEDVEIYNEIEEMEEEIEDRER